MCERYPSTEFFYLYFLLFWRSNKTYSESEKISDQKKFYFWTFFHVTGFYFWNSAKYRKIIFCVFYFLKISLRGCGNEWGEISTGSSPAGSYMFKVNIRNTRTRCEICLKLTIKTPERRQWSRSSVFIVNFECISYLVPVFLLLTLSSKCQLGQIHLWSISCQWFHLS